MRIDENQIALWTSVLCRSERGRKVAADLHTFLNGPVSQLDAEGWECVCSLLQAYVGEYAGTVLSNLVFARETP